jgi:hypothetical protein
MIIIYVYNIISSMEEEDVESPPKSSKREREEDSSAERSPHSRSRKRSRHTTSIVTTTKDRVGLLARNGMVELLIKRLLDDQHLPPYSHSTKKVNNQMLQLRNMVPTASNILLTDVKIFYAVLPRDQRERPFKKMYRYVFFRFDDAIFSLKLTEQKAKNPENRLFADQALPFIFRDNKKEQICTLGNLLQSNSSVESAMFESGSGSPLDTSYENTKNCRINKDNKMLRKNIRGSVRYGQQQEYDNLVQALQEASDSNKLQMVVPNLESLCMLLLKLGVSTEAEAGAIKQIFRENKNVQFLHMDLEEINTAIDRGTSLTKMLQDAVSSSKGGSRRSSKRRKSRTMKKRK